MVIFDNDTERCNSGITRNNTIYIYRVVVEELLYHDVLLNGDIVADTQ